MIDISVSHTIEESYYNNPLENIWPILDRTLTLKEVNALLDSIAVLDTNQWKLKVEPLPVSTSVPVPSIIEPPELELKLLSDTLKYVFLGNSETLSVIISSHLDKDQERKLLDVLSEHKKSIG